ncbi:MAG TPA: proline--tRNA ligase [Methylomusa anaerophila]|uniref:Proline--tRNA ligase n=1 Tax=Methylomusa anaerophila TaxID=1930071 RepID=A0A348APZ5_9FIRM|nr:proline--tRNA ligase [Methylomusa anaerophila]BBB93143.1 proline--tRNA ligase [Methylomusa anaerophila]HML87024.1 proline--tRNA ligase [Methylomusa anaerophila]
MRASQLYAPTLRETPAEAEVISHQLMLRAGFIRKAAGGIYSYLPLAWRVLRKIENIVREEMDAKGGQELFMPVIQPAEMWMETGRWSVYGDEMFRLKDRHNRDFCLGPTHEEMITTLVRGDVRSYRQLPLRLYQIQNKYRDEIRPRFGLMRGREFIMKDLYSFDKDEAGLDESYDKMYDAYTKIFSRCGLTFRAVEADSGAIGGSGSHEFMVIADSGEAAIVYCPSCEYTANVEKAELHPIIHADEELLPLTITDTPGTKTIAAVSKYLGVAPARTIKTLAYITDGEQLIFALVRGDHEVNEIKLLNKLKCLRIDLATEDVITRITGSTVGYLGPVGVQNSEKVAIVADHSVMNMYNAVCGANQPERHYINVNPKRDFSPFLVADIRLIRENDPCPRCGIKVKTTRGIEVGQVFKLYTKYSKALQATFIDENGIEKPMVMGCYGVGVSRTMAAAIEQNYDENGIIWPVPIAPYQAVVVPVNAKDEAQMSLAEKIYSELNGNSIETVLDDRNERPGVKFKDADLIGYPLRITVGPKALSEGLIEVKIRRTGETSFFKAEDYIGSITQLMSGL